MKSFSLIFAAVGLAIAAPAAVAADRAGFYGCPEPGVEDGCVIVTFNGKTYNVSAARPTIEFKGFGVSGSGVAGDGISHCMQGVVLTDIKYQYTHLPCPAPKPPARH